MEFGPKGFCVLISEGTYSVQVQYVYSVRVCEQQVSDSRSTTYQPYQKSGNVYSPVCTGDQPERPSLFHTVVPPRVHRSGSH